MVSVDVSRRAPLLLALTTMAALVAVRAVPFMAPGVRLDADQAVVGLMAKHISEGRAFPVHFYGQGYLLAVEAYLAAPVMWVLGPTEVALKLPLLLMNVAAAGLLVGRAVRDLGLSPWLALVGALPVVLPAVTPGSRLMDAMGGNVEPLLYTLVLWSLRARPWLFASAFGVFVAHREFTLLAGAALGVLDLWWRRGRPREIAAHWALAALAVVVVQGAVATIRPHGDMFGPGSERRADPPVLSVQAAIRAQVCLVPSAWPERGRQLVTAHWPLMVGGAPGPMLDVTISSGMGHGHPGLTAWTAWLVVAGLGCGAWAWHTRRRGSAEGSVVDQVPAEALPLFLATVGVLSTTVYGLVACSDISQATLRYDLLGLFLPTGVLLAALRVPARAARAGLVTATLIWSAVHLDDYRALGSEIRRGRWPDHRGEAIRALERRNLGVLWGDYRLAYVLTFRSHERLTIAAATVPRIDEYARRAAGADVPFLKSGPCAGGEILVPDIWLCPPIPVVDRPPLY